MIDAPARPVTTVTAPGAAAPQRSEARRALTAASLTLAAFLALAVAVSTGSTLWLDEVGRPLSAWAAARGLDPLLVDVEVVFGRDAMTAYAVLLVVALLVAARAPRLAALAGVATFGTAYATSGLKDLLGRARPEWQLADHHHDTFAFPSGHASSVTALVGVLVVVTWTLTADHPARRTITSLVSGVGLGLVVLIAADRVLLGRHYPTDVLGGALLATVVVLLTALALGLFARRATSHGDLVDAGSDHDERALAA